MTYRHIGAQPIYYRGEAFVKGDLISAPAEDMEFFLLIGAVEENHDGLALPDDFPEEDA